MIWSSKSDIPYRTSSIWRSNSAWIIRTNYVHHMLIDLPSLNVYRWSHSSSLTVKHRQVWIGVNPSAVYQQTDLVRNNRKNADFDLFRIWIALFSLHQSIYHINLPHICRNQPLHTFTHWFLRQFKALNWIFMNFPSW